MTIDLLSLVDQGGCSAKLSAKELADALEKLPKVKDENLLVDIETHDDAGVYKIRDDYALIQTTDFFPPVCSDPYDFGQIAAANALSDIYAMGGEVISALNLVMFPANLNLEILQQILLGGHDKVTEAGGLILGGHTIADDIPKYGLAVTGWAHPKNIATNNRAKPGEVLILTKAIGSGIIISAKKNDLVSESAYKAATDNMKQLNNIGAKIMNQFKVKAATDITGFGLLGHAMKMAEGSGVTIRFDAEKIPILPEVMNLIEMGCIPGAAFRNQEFVDGNCYFDKSISYDQKMLLLDAQTSGGLFMSVKKELSKDILASLIDSGYLQAAIVGEVANKTSTAVSIH